MAIDITFDSSSTLGAMTIIGLVAWIGGKSLSAALPSVGSQISGIGQGVFFLGLIVWLLFIIPTILRNWDAL
jgi:hypothetical protein